jgi:uncharacterized protein (DUF1330 family)
MAEAYMIIGVDVNDVEAFGPYAEQVPPMMAKYGGEVVVANETYSVLEGEFTRQRAVILKFPSMERAQAFYDSEEYAPMIELRKAVSDGDLVLVEGL